MVKGNAEKKKVIPKCPDRSKAASSKRITCRFPKKDQKQKPPCNMKVSRRDAETESRRLI